LEKKYSADETPFYGAESPVSAIETTLTYPVDLCIHRCIELQVERTPDAIALAFEDAHLTYAQLNQHANQIAHLLCSYGVRAETFVGLCFERSIEMVIAMLGILKAGGAYIPLDPHSPVERLAFVLQDANINILLTQKVFVDLFDRFQLQVLYTDIHSSILAGDAPTPFTQKDGKPVPALINVANAAYVIYTSGSTGKPKGVLIPHSALMSHAFAFNNQFAIQAGDRIPQAATVSFDIAVEELFPSLLTGATVVLKPDHSVMTPKDFMEYVDREQLTIINLTASYWHELVQEMLDAQLALPRSLRLAVIGAEKVSAERLHAWQKIAGKQVRWYNVYGPTEATVTASCYEATSLTQDYSDTSVPIGFPLLNTQLYVLDQMLQPVPTGATGELYIAGKRLARGYIGRSDLTAEKFIPHPFSSEPGARLYRTGDLVRSLDDGALEFLGRIDQQIKLRGFRIEPGEIEVALSSHPSIRETMVTVHENPKGEMHLITYYILSQQQNVPTSSELRDYLQMRLPSYMLPTVFVQLATLPLNQNGKRDAQLLPPPNWNMLPPVSEQATYSRTDPESPLEEILASLWHEILGLVPLSQDANFFELGGHSLLATRLLSRIRQVFSVELPLRQFFQAPTFLAMQRALEAELQRDTRSLPTPLDISSPLLPVLPRSIISTIPSYFPLSFAQQRLWFLDQLQPNTSLYNIPLLLHLHGPLSIQSIQRSLEALVERQESLRTSFAFASDGQPVQCIHSTSVITLHIIDLNSLPQQEQEKIIHSLVQQEAELPFDLITHPLLRVRLLRLHDNAHILLLTLHHIICDGWSIGILLDELSTNYHAYLTETALVKPSLALQYADYASWQRNWLKGAVLSTQLSYWREHLAGAPDLLLLPIDRPRPLVSSSRGATYLFSLPASLAEALKALSRRLQVTLFMTLFAAFATLLSRYSGQTDLVIGTPIANRRLTETEALIGFFVNTLALRLDLGGDPHFDRLLQRVRDVTLAAYAHQDLPFELLVEELHPHRDLSHSPLFQVLFVLQNTPLPSLNFSDLDTELYDVAWSIAKFDLTLTLEENQRGMEGRLEYSTDLFEAATIEQLAQHWLTLLAGVVEQPEHSLSQLPLLSSQERTRLLVDLNATQLPLPSQYCVHQLFEEQARRTPEAIAVVSEQFHLSYQVLEQRANQLAHFLQEQGAGPEQRIGLCLPRSPELVIALLAILKAGAAYVPLDPSYPAERLAFMIEQVEMQILLTTRQFAGSFPASGTRVLFLEEQETFISQHSKKKPIAFESADMLCYVIYTSGSTGKPKGVCLQHRALVNLISWQHSQATDTNILQRTIQFSSLVFDPLFQEVFSTLSEGGTLVLLTEAIRQEPESLLAFMDEQGIERIYLPFVALHQLVEVALAEHKILPALREILTAGEQLQATSLLRSWLKQLPLCRLYNYYGPSETHVVTSYLLDAQPESWAALPPIGRPIANTKAYVLDLALNPVPVGVVGELYIGGTSVGRGYAGAPDFTAERFIPDPFSSEAGAVLYKTGDLVRYLPDNTIEFLGRVDLQVKIRGYRVEPGEIKALLHQHQWVRDCAIVVDSQPTGNRLLAYIVEQSAGEQTKNELHASLQMYLKGHLPDYMLPTAYIPVAALPLTNTGKVDRKELLAMHPVQVERGDPENLAPPRNELEQQLLEIWIATLGINNISIHDNFFELGGHSLLATRLMLQIRSMLQPDFPLRTLFEHPTIAGLADAMLKKEIEEIDEKLLLQLLGDLDADQVGKI
jgi:amino acid adenylation domain-containing protein